MPKVYEPMAKAVQFLACLGCLGWWASDDVLQRAAGTGKRKRSLIYTYDPDEGTYTFNYYPTSKPEAEEVDRIVRMHRRGAPQQQQQQPQLAGGPMLEGAAEAKEQQMEYVGGGGVSPQQQAERGREGPERYTLVIGNADRHLRPAAQGPVYFRLEHEGEPEPPQQQQQEQQAGMEQAQYGIPVGQQGGYEQAGPVPVGVQIKQEQQQQQQPMPGGMEAPEMKEQADWARGGGAAPLQQQQQLQPAHEVPVM